MAARDERVKLTANALNTLPLAAGAADKEVGADLAAHALGHADLVFPYGR